MLQALGRSAAAYRRMAWAQVVFTVAILVGMVIFLIPGLFAAVVLWLILPAAYLEPGHPASQTSLRLTQGRRWSVLALLLVSRAGVLVTAVAGYPVQFFMARSGFSAEGMVPLMTFTQSGLDLVDELVESFTVAMTLAAYFSLRHAANQEQAVPASPLAA